MNKIKTPEEILKPFETYSVVVRGIRAEVTDSVGVITSTVVARMERNGWVFECVHTLEGRMIAVFEKVNR